MLKNTIYFLIPLFLFSCVMKKDYLDLEAKYKKLQQEKSLADNDMAKIESENTQLKAENSKLKDDANNLEAENKALKDLPKPKIKFTKTSHDFGTIEMESENTYKFEFFNTGNAPLVITGADGDCGCTIPNYPDYAVMPGEQAFITINYIPGYPSGVQRKKITISTNTQEVNYELNIKAIILEPKKK